MVLSEHIVEADAAADEEIIAAVNKVMEELAKLQDGMPSTKFTTTMTGGAAGVLGSQNVSIGEMHFHLAQPHDQSTLAGKFSPNKTLTEEVRIVLGKGNYYENIETAGVNRRRIVRVEIQIKSSLSIANGRVDVVDLDPLNSAPSQLLLRDNISIAPTSSIFVEVACYDVGSSRALPGHHIRLVVPMVGGFFAEAYAYANLPLVPHTFRLRFSRFDQVFDETPCLLYLDTKGVLKLEPDEGTYLTRRFMRSISVLSADREAKFVPLYDAAILIHDQMPRSVADLGHETYAKGDPNKLIIWWCYFLSPRLTVFSEEKPSEEKSIFSDHSQRHDYDLFIETKNLIAKQRSGAGLWVNLCVASDELNYIIRQLKGALGSSAD